MISVENAFAEVVGKRISAVVVKKRPPSSWRLYLVFDDDTSYELYGEGYLAMASGLDKGGLEAVRRYCEDSTTILFEAGE